MQTAHNSWYQMPNIARSIVVGLQSIIITWCSHVCYGPLCDVGHETYDRENDESSEHTGEGVDAADDDRVSEEQTRACNC